MADTPVCINSAGYSLAAGFIGAPLMSILFSGIISGPPSIGLPIPLNTLPSMSGDTPKSSDFPKNLTLLSARFIPVELSNNCTSAVSPFTSNTLHLLVSPFESSISPSSSYVTPSTPVTSIRGPATS